MSKKKFIEVQVLSGVEGPSLYVNNYRIAGPKPWGGGKVLYKWCISLTDLKDDLRRAFAMGKE